MRSAPKNETARGLLALRPGAVVLIGATEYVVERSLLFEHAGGQWTEYRLSSDERGRSLWLEVPERGAPLIAYQRGARLLPSPDPELAGERPSAFVFREAGKATYRTAERAGPGKSGDLFFVDYAQDDRRLTFERHKEDEPWQEWRGWLVDPSTVSVLRA
jgi:hypothetical protein